MHLRRLALAALLLAGSAACSSGPCDPASDPATLDLGVADDLYALAALDPADPARDWFAVGAAGVIVESRAGVVTVHRPVTRELRAVTVHAGSVIAVGDDGTLVRRPVDGADWEVVDLGTPASLRAIASDGATLVAAGDDTVLVYDEGIDAWAPAPAPGAWGSLRVVVAHSGGFAVFGLAGASWAAVDPRDAWTDLDVQTDADLLAGAGDLVAGTRGAVLEYSLGEAWNLRPLADGVRPDFVAVAGPATLLAADGHVYDLSPEGVTDVFALADGLTALASSTAGDRRLLAVGLGGRAVALDTGACGLFD